MSQLATVTHAQSLTQAKPAKTMADVVQAHWDRISATLPKHMNSERFLQLAISTVNQTPELAICKPVEVLSCLMKCSTLGLEPDAVDGLGRAYIIPTKIKGRQSCRFQMGYRGMLELMDRSGKIKSYNIMAAYEDDGYQLTLDENGVPHLVASTVNFNAVHTPETLQFVYLHVEYMNGGEHNAYMTKAEIERVKSTSQSANSNYSPWKTSYEAMALKTLIRREFKYMPVSIEAQSVVSADDTLPDYSAVFKPVIETPAPQLNEAHVEAVEDVHVDVETGEILEVQTDDVME